MLRQGVWPELLEDALLLAEEQGPVQAQARCERGIYEVARIRRAHLEEHARLKLLEARAIQRAIEVVDRVAPGQRVNAVGGAFSDDVAELFVRLGRRIGVVG